ncbi:MAG: hypothetical protein HY084_11980 [Gemmatimonadetes bacterium]|nr:hypothetical protein [Gemmatimonadota bacterium]
MRASRSQEPKESAHVAEAQSAASPPALESLLAWMPDEALLPVHWLRAALAAERARAADPGIPEMLTTTAFCEHYRPARTAEWVRDMCNAARFPGAVRRGRQWLIPSACLMEGPTPANTERFDAGATLPASRGADVARGPRLAPRKSRGTHRY